MNIQRRILFVVVCVLTATLYGCGNLPTPAQGKSQEVKTVATPQKPQSQTTRVVAGPANCRSTTQQGQAPATASGWQTVATCEVYSPGSEATIHLAEQNGISVTLNLNTKTPGATTFRVLLLRAPKEKTKSWHREEVVTTGPAALSGTKAVTLTPTAIINFFVNAMWDEVVCVGQNGDCAVQLAVQVQPQQNAGDIAATTTIKAGP